MFINYYRMKKRLGFPTVIKAAAGYDELPRHDRYVDEDLAVPNSGSEEDFDAGDSMGQVCIPP